MLQGEMQTNDNERRSVTAVPAPAASAFRFRHPVREDGPAVHQLIADCPPLDANSLYCNFLQSTHFSSTCMLAERGGEVLGWVSGYRPQDEPDTLFIWQVAVSGAARGEGLAKRVINALLDSDGCEGVNRIRTTITPGNEASWSLFRSLARSLDAPIQDKVWLHEEHHFDGAQDSEHMVVIGPFAAGRKNAA